MTAIMWGRWAKALGVLSGTVLLHEVAHAVAARRVGGKVSEVGIGFGPRLLARRFGDTLVSLRPLLFGGFAAIDVERLPPERRIPVLLAGPLANILAGLLLLPARVTPAQVSAIVPPGSPRVQLAGLIGALSMLLRVDNATALRFLAAQINLSVGLANLLPLMPLDGGHLAMARMEAKGVPADQRNLFRQISALLFFRLLLAVLLQDLRRIGRRPSAVAAV